MIDHPRSVVLPKKNVILCTYELDPESDYGKNFLYVNFHIQLPWWKLKLLFFKGKFAITIDNGKTWFLLPSMTPHWRQGNTIKYGFIQRIAKKYESYLKNGKATIVFWWGGK
jgi:hypothetical protein